ncbi:MAG: CARDB domain-containing protein [Candidatus Micrarchaeia archaeon]
MSKNNMWILGGVIVVIFLAVVFYFSFMPKSNQISVSIIMNSINTTVYPYQTIYASANIINTGNTSFSSVPFGLLYNGSLVEVYNISLPAGKYTQINFSKEALIPGKYQLKVVLDPIGNEQLSTTSTSENSLYVNILNPQNPMPYSLLSSNNSYEKFSNEAGDSYVVTSYLYNAYGLSVFRLSDIPAVTAFLSPIMNLTYSLLNKIYTAQATYKNSTVYSVWIQGPINQKIIYEAGKGANLTTYNKTLNGTDVSFVQLDKNTTLCSWYQEGWTKSLAIMGSPNCFEYINKSKITNTITLYPDNQLRYLGSNDLIYNMTFNSIVGKGYGKLFILNRSFVFESVEPNLVGNNVCYGLINNVNNRSYCSSYIFKNNNNSIGAISAMDTKVYVGNYNLSVISLINTSLITEQVLSSINILQKINYTGKSEEFSSGISSSCIFNASLACSLPVFGLNGLTMNLKNNLNTTFRINKVACYGLGNKIFTTINDSIAPNSNTTITVPCYDNGNVISGVSLGLYLNMVMNYTISKSNYTALGRAYLI